MRKIDEVRNRRREPSAGRNIPLRQQYQYGDRLVEFLPSPRALLRARDVTEYIVQNKRLQKK